MLGQRIAPEGWRVQSAFDVTPAEHYRVMAEAGIVERHGENWQRLFKGRARGRLGC